MSKSAFVTGGTGFVGTNLVKRLCADGWTVTALHRPTSNVSILKRFPVQLVPGDLTDAGSLERAMPGDLDAVFHVASDLSCAAAGAKQQRRSNVDGTRFLIEASQRRRARRFIYTSTLGTYGGRAETFDESAPQLGATASIHYSRTKWEAEEVVRAAARDGLDAVILNPGGILGPYDARTWGAFFFLVRDGLLPYTPEEGVMVWCHVDDVVDAHLAAVERGRRGESYILGGEEAPLWRVLEGMARLLGMENRSRRIPAQLLGELARVQTAISAHTGEPVIVTPELIDVFADTYRCRIDKAVRELGYRTHTLDEMLADCHAWLRDEGLLAKR